MDKFHIRENLSTGYQWSEILNPHLAETGIQYERVVLLSAITLYKHYVCFLRVKQIPFEKDRDIWTSPFIKVVVTFDNSGFDVKLSTVHNISEIQSFKEGKFLVDRRSTEFPTR